MLTDYLLRADADLAGADVTAMARLARPPFR